MLLQAPDPSPYDLNFSVAGIHIRVSYTFWLGTLFFGYQLVRSFDQLPGSPGFPVLLMLWALCLLVSIGIHELGHSLALAYFGIHSHIVLYHFGGLAIPTSSRSIGRVGTQLSPSAQFIVSAAGPGMQVLSALVLMAVVYATGHVVEGIEWFPQSMAHGINQNATGFLDPPALRATVAFYLIPSVFWALLNLVPVYPLDGGQMFKAVVDGRGGRSAIWLWTSVVAAALMVLYGVRHEQWFLAILFASFAVANYQSLNPHERY